MKTITHKITTKYIDIPKIKKQYSGKLKTKIIDLVKMVIVFVKEK